MTEQDRLSKDLETISKIPGESRLLTPEEIDVVFDKWSEETQGSVSKELGNTFSQAIAKA